MDLTGHGHNLDFQGTVPPVLDTTTYAYHTMRYSNLYLDRQRSFGRYPSSFRGKTFCFIHAMDLGSGETEPLHRRSVMEGDIQATTGQTIASQTSSFDAASSAKYHINGLDSRPADPWNNDHATNLSVVSYQTNGSSGIGANVIGHGRGGGSNRYGLDGVIGEILIFDSYLSVDDIRRVEGWMAHKWGITSALQADANNVPHPYRLSAPVNNDAFMVNGWSLESGIWDTTELIDNSVLISSNNTPITVRQMVNLTFGEVYEVTIDRDDADHALVVKLKTDVNVRWISHQDDETDIVDIPHGEGAIFKVIGTVPSYIEIDTVTGDLSVTNITLFRKRLASGTITETTNNTIYKSTGVDGWNAGTSSLEHFDGQAEAYVQFQMAQTGKSIKIGLTHNDINYINTSPYQMLFTGTYVFIEDFQYPYATGDWFRIRHDSVNNQILYQKRGTNLLYSTIYTHSGTTDGRDFYLDTSFYHEGGRINDISMVSGAGEGVDQGPIYPWGVGPTGPEGTAGVNGADGTPGGPVGPSGADGVTGPAGAEGVGRGTYFIPQTDGLIIAHRGYSGNNPENTLQAFNKAWEEKSDGIEADCRLTSDGIVVCIHDEETNRTVQNEINLTVSSSTYNDLNDGDYGTGVGDLPTLEDVLNTIPRGKIIHIELKDNSKNMIDAVKIIIDAHDIQPNQVKIISFEEGSSTTGLQYAKSIMPNYNTLLLKNFGSDTSAYVIDTSLELIKTIKADGYLVNKTLFLTHDNTTYINKIKDAGLFLGVYTNNVYADSIILQDRGVDSITTDNPNLHHDFRIKKMKTYQLATLNKYHIDGDTTVVTGFNTNSSNTTDSKHIYFKDNSWWSSFDGSLVQTWNTPTADNTVVLTFKTEQDTNETILSSYGSAITTTTDAHITTGMGCPDIDIDWNTAGGNGLDFVWEIHSGGALGTFNTAFGDNLPVLQMDLNDFNESQGGGSPTNPTIKFSTTTATAQVKIVGFRIGDATDRTVAASAWILNIYENDTVNGNKVYTQTTNAMGAGDFQDIVINYMGEEGVDYMLEFDDQGTNGYTTAINNLTFEQHTAETPTGDTYIVVGPTGPEGADGADGQDGQDGIVINSVGQIQLSIITNATQPTATIIHANGTNGDLNLSIVTQIYFGNDKEIISSAGNDKLLYREIGGAWNVSPIVLDRHQSIIYRESDSAYYVCDTDNHRIVRFTDLASSTFTSVSTLNNIALDRPHDILLDPITDKIMVLNPYSGVVFRFDSFGVYEESINFSTGGYARAISWFDDALHIIGSYSGKVIKVNSWDIDDIDVYQSYGNSSNESSGSWASTGLVLNDVEKFNGRYYATSYFYTTDEKKFISFDSWADFVSGNNWTDLSHLIPDSLVPYYMTVNNDDLYIPAFRHSTGTPNEDCIIKLTKRTVGEVLATVGTFGDSNISSITFKYAEGVPSINNTWGTSTATDNLNSSWGASIPFTDADEYLHVYSQITYNEEILITSLIASVIPSDIGG